MHGEGKGYSLYEVLDLHCTGEVFYGGRQGGSFLCPGPRLRFLLGQLGSDPLLLCPLLCLPLGPLSLNTAFLLGLRFPCPAFPCPLLCFLLRYIFPDPLLQ